MKASTRTPVAVKLYMKAGCHLCEDAEAALARLQHQYPHTLERIDIAADPELLQQYGEQIPVVALNGREYAAPLSRSLLERALHHAANQRDRAQPAPPAGDSVPPSTASGARRGLRGSAPGG